MAFNRVSRSFHAVRDEVHHSDSEQARADLRPVADAYYDVEHNLGEYSGTAEYPESSSVHGRQGWDCCGRLGRSSSPARRAGHREPRAR